MTKPTDRRALISLIMQAQDDVVAVLQYRDEWGRITERIVSPIRFLDDGRFLALCLCRQQTRSFYLGRCLSIRAASAADVLAPVPIKSPVASV